MVEKYLKEYEGTKEEPTDMKQAYANVYDEIYNGNGKYEYKVTVVENDYEVVSELDNFVVNERNDI